MSELDQMLDSVSEKHTVLTIKRFSELTAEIIKLNELEVISDYQLIQLTKINYRTFIKEELDTWL